MSFLAVLQQVTLDDVLAQVSADGLDFVAFMKAALPLLASAGEVGTDDDTNFIRCLVGLKPGDLEEAGVAQGWLELKPTLAKGAMLVHPSRKPLRQALQKQLRYSKLVMPLTRTLACKVEHVSWDKVTMPSDTVGPGTTLDELVDNIAAMITATPGGTSYLAPARVERALAVVATTLAVVLSDVKYCQRSPENVKHRLVRPDMYEAAVRSMKLERHFQIIRRLVELDHIHHLPMNVHWPTPVAPARPRLPQPTWQVPDDPPSRDRVPVKEEEGKEEDLPPSQPFSDCELRACAYTDSLYL